MAVKEVLHNIIKHAQAENVRISIRIDKDLLIRVHDNGIGFNRDNIRPYSNGLNNIEKRMKEIGGFVEFKNTNGTSVTLRIPITEQS